MNLGDIPVPVCSPCRPVHSGKRVRGMPLLKASVAVRLTCEAHCDQAHPADLHNILFAGWRRPYRQIRKKIAGSPWTPDQSKRLSFIVEAGPEAFRRICEDLSFEGNFDRYRRSAVLGSLGCGRYPSSGTANAAQRPFEATKKDAEVGLRPSRASSPHIGRLNAF